MKIKIKNLYWMLALCLGIIISSCGEEEANVPLINTTNTPPKTTVKVPRFDRDSAYQFVKKQVDFGPRVPNSEGHQKAKDWMVAKFKNYGAQVIEQDFQAQAYDGTQLNATNIIAQFNSNNKKRILLAAHWDTRPIADSDLSTERRDEPILGADDGGSGVAILLEIARQLQANPINMGVDLILFDAEDYGAPREKEEELSQNSLLTWCLGSQHWSKNPHIVGYKAKYGILLDMVGSKGARFTKEAISMRYAPQVMNKIWKLAQGMGYGNYFVNNKSDQVIDDHLFVNEIAKIPMIDIINRTPSGFGPYWHTHNDNIKIIDKSTLRAVGQVMLAVIYREYNGTF